jgi:hypothetical protein
MSYLQNKLRRIEEVNYINRTMRGASKDADVVGYVHFNEPPPPKPDDIIKVWKANPDKEGWLMMVEMPRSQHEAEVKAMNDAFEAKKRKEEIATLNLWNT